MTPLDERVSTKPHDLLGWKEIAKHLGCGVRTAQRWERELDLPVRRFRRGTGETVYAVCEELDEWKSAVTLTRESGGDQAVALSADGDSGAVRRRVRTWLTFVVIAGALALLASGVWALSQWRHPGSRSGIATTAETVLDPGPWPTAGHDMRRTNQSRLRGPRAAASAVLLYELHGLDDWPDELVSTMDGRLVFGACGWLIAVDHQGRELWKREMRSVSGLPVHPAGFAVTVQSNVLATGHECPNSPDSVETYLYEIAPNGTEGQSRPIGSAFVSPAIGRGRDAYTIDEVNFLRIFRPWLDPAGGTTLAGFLTGGIAVDPLGNLYVGTDGGRYHQSSLWSLSPQGEVRWQQLKEELGLPVIGHDRVYVASLTGNVFAFSLDGRQLWSRALGAIGSLQPLSLGASGRLYVQTRREIVGLSPAGDVVCRVGYGSSDQGHGHAVLDSDENGYAWLGGNLISFDRNGRERWRLSFPPILALILGDEGTLYATTTDKKLYKIGETRSSEVTAGRAPK